MPTSRVAHRVGAVLLAIGVLAALFLLSPLAPHSATAVVVGTSAAAVPVRVTDRGGARVAPLEEVSSMTVDLARPDIGQRLPVLTYRSGRVVYDTGSLLPSLWTVAAVPALAGAVVLLRTRRQRRPVGRGQLPRR